MLVVGQGRRLRFQQEHHLPQRSRVERLRIVGLDDPQILVQRVRLVGIGRQRAVDVDAVGHFERFAAAADREFHRVQTRPQIDVVDLGLVARLPVAEIPLELPLHRQRFRRIVAEQRRPPAARRCRAAARRRRFWRRSRARSGRSAARRCPPPGGRRGREPKTSGGIRRGCDRIRVRRADLPERRPSSAFGPAAAWSYSNLCRPAASCTSCRLPGNRQPHRPVIARRRRRPACRRSTGSCNPGST